ncbi:MAG: hypothetical protein R2804_07765 [Cyclobacteriaceae bacterium]
MTAKLIEHQNAIIFLGTYTAILGGALSFGYGVTTGGAFVSGVLIFIFLIISLGTLAVTLLTAKMTVGLIIKVPLIALLTLWSYFLVTGLYSIVTEGFIFCALC